MAHSQRSVLKRRAGPGERGVALLTFALSFVLLCGIMTLVLDVGWGFYIAKKAQTASDAAALAAITEALAANGPDAAPSCGRVHCQAMTSCPSGGTLQPACSYASAGGFVPGGDHGNQRVDVAAGTTSPPPGVPNVPVDYWVQVTTSHRLPRWFSGFLASAGLNPNATSTAALRRTSITASLYLLNRHDDCFVSALGVGLVCGQDFLAVGANTLNARGGIYMSSSNSNGLGLPAIAAGTVTGVATVNAPFTYLMGKGEIQNLVGSNNWNAEPVNGFPDGDYFTDPFAGRPQPPAPSGLPDHPVPGGIIRGGLLPTNPAVLPPGKYFATVPILGTPTGTPLTITGHVVFSDGSPSPCGGFCNYEFYGGIITAPASNITFSPGRYIIAGASPVSGGPGLGLSVGALSVLKDMTPLVGGRVTRNTDAGEIFIFTSSNYPGLVPPAALLNSGLSFPQARAGIVAGLQAQVTLHGLNADSNALPSELEPYAPVLIWQDRANTTLKYTSNGLLDMTCGGPCENILSIPGSQEMIVMGSQSLGRPGTNLYGTIYGPRLSWLTIVGLLPGDTVAGPLQIITGALQMTLNARLDVDPVLNPPKRLVMGLVQ